MRGMRRCSFLGKRAFVSSPHDRRGHGRSGQSWDGNNMDQYADDLAELMEHLDIKGATMVGHSTGGGEVVRCIARHGQTRVAKVVFDRRGSPADAEKQRRIRAAFLSRSLMRYAPMSSMIDHSSSRICPLRSMDTNKPDAKGVPGGAGIVLAPGHAGVSHWAHTTALRLSRRRTRPKISKRSMFRRS